MFQKIAIGLGVLIVVIAVGIYYLSQNAGNMVAGVIKDEGSRVTQVPVDVSAVDISLTDLKAGLRGLTVGNPTGFKTDRAISLGEISVKIAKDWSMDVIVIDEVMVNAPEITYEIGTGGSNIAAIQKNVEDSLKAMGGSAEKAPADEEKAGPKIVINNFYIKNGKINVSSSLLQGTTLPVALPDIHLKDIGKDNKDGSDGASTAQVIDEVMTAITKKAGTAAGSLDLSALGLSDISGTASKVGAAAKDAATGALKGAGDTLGGAGEGIGGAVKGLFGK
ncbi:AsmA family protein [Magnetovibrio blakemorei]|uniref:AsmA domain-containing protein n=1 Tax=Magnetovibrio blakemorei TaxID=28181 RepID=A0A1E5Q7B9_9PROT|nr:hypothetical protein [Magnetovibrio blakemorei]OEJ66923.1 hypothetical protein BEN30_11045 [Magnetovibrio blakemorei]